MQQIRIESVSKRFDDYLALDRVTLDVEGGEFLSILGPSGCGKSTLLRIIAGLEAPSDGDVHIAGKRVTGDPVWKREIGFVFQNFALWPHLSVFRNVSMGLELRKLPKAEIEARVREVLRLVQLEALANRLPAQLSGGQQQRVALARAVVLKPQVLLLDEPLSALDKNLRQNMQVELKSLQRTLGLTSIFVTHDQEEALSLSDRVVVMNKGVIEQVGTPQEIYSTPRTEYVAGFVGEACFFRGTVEGGNVLRLADGAVVPLAAPASVGTTIAAFVRPEWIKLETPAGGRSPVGVFERLIYFGQSSDHLVRLGERQIRVKHREGDRIFASGESVALVCKAWPLAESATAP